MDLKFLMKRADQKNTKKYKNTKIQKNTDIFIAYCSDYVDNLLETIV